MTNERRAVIRIARWTTGLALVAVLGCQNTPDHPDSGPASRPAESRASADSDPEPNLVMPEVRSELVPTKLDSAEAIARRVIEGLDKSDVNILRSLLVQEDEYRDVIWPGQVQKNKNLEKQNWQLHWALLHNKSLAGSGDFVGEYRGRDVEFISMRWDRIDDFETFKAWRFVYVKMLIDGRHEVEKRVFGAIIERDGKFNLLSFPS